MHTQTIEGIVIKTIPYQDQKNICLLFTQEGIISCICRHSKKEPEKKIATTTLTHAEYLLSSSRGHLRKIEEASILSSYLNYPKDYKLLEVAAQILDAIYKTQKEEKPSLKLYELTLFYLRKLKETQNRHVILASFWLKTLAHEGSFSLDHLCTLCEKKEVEGFYKKDGLCSRCLPKESIFFNEEEKKIVEILTYGKEFARIKEIVLDDLLYLKIRELFESFCT